MHKAFRYFYRKFWSYNKTAIIHIVTYFLCITTLIINTFDSMVHRFPDSKEKSVGPFHYWCTISESVSSWLVLSFPDTLIDMLLKSMTSQKRITSTITCRLPHYYYYYYYYYYYGITVHYTTLPSSKTDLHCPRSCDLRHQFLSPLFFRSSWTDSSDPNFGFPTHRVPSGLRSVRFLEGSTSCILKSVYFNTVLQFSSGPYSHRHTKVQFFGTFRLLPHRLITRFTLTCPINSAAMFIPEWLKWYCSSQGTVYFYCSPAFWRNAQSGSLHANRRQNRIPRINQHCPKMFTLPRVEA
jgi:hypothetical protein